MPPAAETHQQPSQIHSRGESWAPRKGPGVKTLDNKLGLEGVLKG